MSRLANTFLLATLVATSSYASAAPPDADLIRARANFRNENVAPVTLRAMEAFFPTELVSARPNRLSFPKGADLKPIRYRFDNQERSLDDMIAQTYTNAMVVVRNGKIVYELYRNGANAASRFQIQSISKSVNSLLIGQAIGEGRIGSVDDPIDRYIPELRGSAYEGVSIADALQMQSGVAYDDNGQDAERFNAMVVRNETGNTVDFAKTLSKRVDGRPFNYSTLESCILGEVVARATGMSLAKYTTARLWGPGGMQYSASWWIDGKTGHGLAGGGLNASARDLAKIGQIILDRGRVNGNQVVPAAWIDRLTGPSGSAVNTGEDRWSYRDQWWIDRASGAIVGRGYMGQLLYIHRPSRTVIVKFSYVPSTVEFLPVENEMMAAFDAIAASP